LIHKGPICGASSELSYVSGIDEAHASALLLEDVAYAERAVSHLVTISVTQGQFDALVSFTYNLGATALAGSHLLKYLNAGDVAGAADQFAVWVHGEGVYCQD
jgi:lysozyme